MFTAAGIFSVQAAIVHLSARMMNQDDKHLEGWYLQMCDPTLPEATIPEPVTTPEEPVPVEAIEPEELDGTSGL